MTVENFDELLSFIRADITKENTNMREAIPPEVKLAITIRFLATGNYYQDISCNYRVHKSTICKFIPTVCEASYRRLKDKFLKVRTFFSVAIEL